MSYTKSLYMEIESYNKFCSAMSELRALCEVTKEYAVCGGEALKILEQVNPLLLLLARRTAELEETICEAKWVHLKTEKDFRTEKAEEEREENGRRDF